ncbi:MAG: cell wall-binding repeat-containing protein, partial [Coriobacteriales bacterium]
MHARINRRRTRAVAVLAIALVTALPAQALASTITGTVKEWAAEGGGPMLGNVKVEVFDAGDIWTDGTLTSYGSAITAADGTYTITGLPNDTVVIVAFADTTGTHRDMVWPGTGKPVEWSPYGLMTGSEDASETSNVDGYLMTLGDLFANRTSRVAGVDRYETAVRISQYYFGSADTVVIASGASFADALSASTLAGAYGAPLLLTSKSTLPDVVGDEIEALGATKAYIIGGTGVVDAGCAAQIAARGVTIQRIAGNNRYHTGELVIRELPMEYIEDGTVALVARGDAFADALSASPFAYYDGFPILLTQPGALPTESQRAWQYLVDHGTDMAFVIGGTSAVSDNVIAQMDSRVPGGLYGDRLEGSDRYGTASVVADFFYGWFGPYDFM